MIALQIDFRFYEIQTILFNNCSNFAGFDLLQNLHDGADDEHEAACLPADAGAGICRQEGHS